MKCLSDEVVCIRILEDKIKRSEREANESRKSIVCIWEKIIKAIRTGVGTTGNKIHDFIILRYLRLDLDYVEVLEDLGQRLEGKTGQFVLLVESKLQKSPMKLYAYPHRSNMIPPLSRQILEVCFSLGIISGSTLIMDNIPEDKCYLPTSKCLYYDHWSGLMPVRTCNFPIVAATIDFIMQSKKEFYHNGRKYFEAEIFIGDEEVKNWLSDNKNKIGTFKRMAASLGRPLEPEQEGSPYFGLSWRV